MPNLASVGCNVYSDTITMAQSALASLKCKIKVGGFLKIAIFYIFSDKLVFYQQL
jgi:hypothetical protein